jgi:hypothetical protein
VLSFGKSSRCCDSDGTCQFPEVGKWLAQVVAGYFAYQAVPTNSPARSAFR